MVGVAQVDVLGVGPDERIDDCPVLLVRERHGTRRCLPIWIGVPEAQALLAASSDGPALPRPLTHQLLLDLLIALGAHLTRVRVTALIAGRFHAVLDLAGDTSEEIAAVSARASDAIIVAIRSGCPIDVADAVLDEAGRPAASIVEFDAVDPARRGVAAAATLEDNLVEQLRHALSEATAADFEHPPGTPDSDDDDPETT